jgi:chaperonin GroES
MDIETDDTTETTKPARRGRLETRLQKLFDWAESRNVAAEMDATELNTIGERVVREFNIDETSRAAWVEKAKRAFDRAKLVRGAKSYPFEGAANVKYPLLTTAALQFASRAYPSIVDGQRVVKCQVIGDDPGGQKKAKADRISQHMSWQLIDQMGEWEEDTDWLLHQLPIAGCAFRKVWWDPVLEINRSEMVSALDLVVNNSARSMETVPRVSQLFRLYPHEIEAREADGDFIAHEWEMSGSTSDDEDAPHDYIEQYRYMDLDDDGVREPWIVTVHKDTQRVARIVANYNPTAIRISDDGRIARIARHQKFVKYPFFRDPQGGFYDLGFGELLDTLSEVIDSTLNQMLDAGHLQNAGGGFIGSGVRLRKDQLAFAPGRYHMVNASGADLRKSIYNMEHSGPSPVLFQLLGMMVDAGKEIASIKDILTGDMPRNQPATTTLAMIEQGMKVYTAIYKRIYRALRTEYRLLFGLNAKHLPEQQYFTILDSRQAVARDDYDIKSMDVCPVADPNIVTDAQRMGRGQVYLEVGTNPAAVQAGVNPRECMQRFFEAVGAEDIEKLLPPPPEKPPLQDELQMRGATADVETKEAGAQKAKLEAGMLDDQAAAAFQQELLQKFAGLHGAAPAAGEAMPAQVGLEPEAPQPGMPI